MAKFIYPCEPTEAYQWDGTDATFLRMVASLPPGWSAVSSDEFLIVYCAKTDHSSDARHSMPVAHLCPRNWWVAVDVSNVNILRPDNFDRYKKVEA